MREADFPFLSSHLLPLGAVVAGCLPGVRGSPGLLAVGDLHVENFGTWRDIEGRLVWGITISMKSAACPIPSTWSAWPPAPHIAIDAGELQIAHRDACAAILGG